jgi:hypothetical protein
VTSTHTLQVVDGNDKHARAAASGNLTFVAWDLEGGAARPPRHDVRVVFDDPADVSDDGARKAQFMQHVLRAGESDDGQGEAPLSFSKAQFRAADDVRSESVPTDGSTRFAPGVAVTITGLKSKPEYNGRRGTIAEPLNEAGRWPVEVHMNSDGSVREGIRCKPENLVYVADCGTIVEIS